MTSKEYIESGILELYVLGIASPDEYEEIEKMAASDPAILREIQVISKSLEKYLASYSLEPSPIIKPFLVATIDYSERLKNGEPVSFPPLLHKHSILEDYAYWLNQHDMVFPGSDNISAKIIGCTDKVTTAIVWIRNYTPKEIHDNEYERFLVIEGTCDIFVTDKINHLAPGDYFAIPLHEYHTVKVTSSIPCKVILQRIAA